MFFIENIQALIFSAILLIGYIVGKFVVQHFFFSKSKYPNHFINIFYKYVRKSINFIIVFCAILIPLNIQFFISRPSVNIIIDNSISMQSEDQNPTRIILAKQIIDSLKSLRPSCISLINEAHIGGCKTLISMQSSGSSVSDALLLSLHQDKNNSKSMRLVLTDGGINTGIALNQVISTENQQNIVRVDIFPSTGNIIINGEIISQQKTLELLPKLDHYIHIKNYGELDKNISQIKKILLLQYYSPVSINKFLYGSLGVLIIFILFHSLRLFRK